MRQIKKRFMALGVFFLAVSLLIAGCGGEDQGADEQSDLLGQAKPLDTTGKKVVVTYKDGKVTEGELNLYLNLTVFSFPELAMMLGSPEVKEQLAKQYVAEKMIAKKVKDEKRFADDADKTLKDFEEGLKKESNKKAIDVYKESGFTRDQLRAHLVNNAKVRDYLDKQVKESDIKEEYEKSWEYYDLKVNHILISTEDPQAQDPEAKPLRTDKEAKKRAEEVKKKLESGGDFKKLAKEYSDDPGSKENAGLIEGVSSGFTPPFSQAAVKLPLDKVSDPVKTEFGYHIIKVSERKKQPYKDVKEAIKSNKIQEVFQEFLEKEVKVELDLPKEPLPEQ